MNAFFASLISFSPTIMKIFWPNPYLQYGGCLFLIASIIIFYRAYTIAEHDKEKLTIGRGTLFGAITGLFLAIFTTFHILILGIEGVRNQMKQAAEASPQAAQAADIFDSFSDTTLLFMFVGGTLISILITVLIGLIAGAIFKTEIED